MISLSRRAPARWTLAALLAAALALYVGVATASHIHLEDDAHHCVLCVSGNAVAAEKPFALLPFGSAAGQQAAVTLSPAVPARAPVQHLARGPPLSD